MFYEDLFFMLVFFVIGMIVGYNLRNARAEEKEQRTFEQVDEQVRKDLVKQKNLNKSLQDDVTFLREKLNKLKS